MPVLAARGARRAKPLRPAAPSQAPTQAPDLTIVSAANDRYRARDLAVLVQMRERATKEGLKVRIVSYNLGGESKCPDGSLPSIWAKYGIEYGEFNFDKYPGTSRTCTATPGSRPSSTRSCRRVLPTPW